MRRLVRRGVALGLAGAAAVGAWGAPAGASGHGGEARRLEATATPARVAPNGEVTLASVDPCPVAGADRAAGEGDGREAAAVELAYAYGPDGWRRRGEAPTAADFAALDADGGWEVTLQAPEGFGAYDVVALCVTQGDREAFTLHGYYDLAFRVARRPVPPAGEARAAWPLWPFADRSR